MRILHAITRLIQGGAQQNTVLSCAAQVKAGHEVHLAYGPIYGPEGSLLEEAKASGAVLYEIKSMRRAVNPWRDLRCYFALRRLIREVQPDIVHTHSSKAGIIGRAAAWAEKTPTIIHTVHGLPFHDRQSALVHRVYVGLERWAVKRCHHLVAITPAMVEAFEAKGIAGRERFTVIPSGIEVEAFNVSDLSVAQAKQEVGFMSDSIVVGLVGRMDPLKGHLDLIGAMKSVVPRSKLWVNCTFVGDGWYMDQVRQVIREGDDFFADHFTFSGLVPLDKMKREYRAMDLVVLPSYQEGQSRVLAEALLCGCGIVAYDVGGIPSICIDGQTGKLVPVGDKQALADAIVWMIEHPDERRAMTERGRQLVREKFSAEYMTRELEKLYQRLLADKTSRQESSHG
jgi:glycosyltransferase involved in cell wall biosynthesis